MKVLITGNSNFSRGLSLLANVTTCRISDITNHDIVLDEYDVFINYGRQGFGQVSALQAVADEWWFDSNKIIINISSRAAQPNISKGYMYAAQKAALNHYTNNLQYNSDIQCRLTTLNLGLMEHDTLPSVPWSQVIEIILEIIDKPYAVPELTIQHPANYLQVQADKLLHELLGL